VTERNPHRPTKSLPEPTRLPGVENGTMWNKERE
jgi:hypothetical protein